MRTPISIVLGLGLWLAVAVAAGRAGLLASAPGAAIGFVNLTLTVATLLLVRTIPSLREWAMVASLRPWIAYHLVRFVGLAFLAFAVAGRLPADFAVKAAWGDIAVAILAGFVAMFALPVVTIRKWLVVFLWNLLGFADILFVLATAIPLAIRDVASMSPLREWPLVLLPTFIVPLILVTHVLVFVRLFKGREAMARRQTL
ncbi:MAG TPA: hypothetical protein VFU59_08690 [Candidatus Eisenbacteria bacterium]|nr:hypothetical protein [Candidatus Eisenbacteria bacterium]